MREKALTFGSRLAAILFASASAIARTPRPARCFYELNKNDIYA